MKLQFAKVIGTLATVPQHVTYSGRNLAYVADGAVIVCEVDAKAGVLGKQRLFVANSGISDGPADDYWGKIDLYLERAESPEKRDEFDIPTENTHVYGSDKILASRKKTAGENAENSPSKLKDRVRSISCVAISPNGRVLAVGESGYQPRILLYSLAPDASGVPFAVIHEHSFGIKEIAFLPDLRHFASLGQLSDGFLNIWKYSATSVSLKAGNKCSLIVNKVVWHLNTSIVTAGLRFLKVWSFEAHDSTKAVVLKGRNVVLGRHLDCDFTQAVSLSRDEVLLSGGYEALYVLSLSGMSIVPVEVPEAPAAFYGLQADTDNRRISYFVGSTPKLLDYLELRPSAVRLAPTSPSKVSLMMSSLSLKPTPSDIPVVSSFMSCREDVTHIISLTSTKVIRYHAFDSGLDIPLVASPVSFAGGMKQASTGDLLVFSKSGEAMIVEDGTAREVASTSLLQSDELMNELCAADFDGSHAFFGDKYGQLMAVNCETNETTLQVKAHSSSINDLVRFKALSVGLLCTISRDRTVQIFYNTNGEWELLQTIASHTGNILFARFHEDSLFVCSADRTISIYGFREFPGVEQPLEVFQKKVITLKHPPTAMEILGQELHVATNDKSVLVYDSSNADFKYSVKLTNNLGELIIVESFAFIDKHIVASFGDRSIRLYSAKYHKELAVLWGHSDAILNMVVSRGQLYSMSSNGCLFIWKVAQAAVESDHSSVKDEDSDLSLPEPDNLPLFAKVTRKILPVASATPKQPRMASTPKFEREASPSRRSLLLADPSSPTPSSLPAPRLTNATLKRIEARNQAKPSLAQPDSPSKSSSPKPVNIKQTSPNRSQSPSRVASRAAGSARLLLLPSRPIDALTNFQPRLAPQNDSDSMTRASGYVSIMKSLAQKGLFSPTEKEKLVDELKDLIRVLGGTSHTPVDYEPLVEKFGQQLVALVQKKLEP